MMREIAVCFGEAEQVITTVERLIVMLFPKHAIGR